MIKISNLTTKFKKGQLLVELLIAIGLSAIILPAILTGVVSSREGKAQAKQRVGAVALLREVEDATRSVKNKPNNWPNFAVNGTFHPEISGSAWSLVANAETINGFTRQVVISDVYRDSSGNIVTSGGTVDPSTKKVVITVSWDTPHLSSISSTLYLSRYSTGVFIDTTVSDFDAGTKTGTAVTNTGGGEVTLAAGGSGSSGDWCQPNLSITALDLPKSGVANAVTAIEGKAFAGTGDNASGVSFANVAINNEKPPASSVVGTFDGYKTNGVFGETDYAYLATDNNFKEIVIIDLNQVVNGKYVEAGYFNAPGNGNGDSIWVWGNTGYMTSANKLYNFDLSSKSGSRLAIDSDGVTLAGVGTRVVIIGSYAYVSISGAATELQIVDVTNQNSLAVVGQADVNGQGAKDVFVNSAATRAYLATGVSDTQSEFFIVDVSTKTGNRPTLGSYDTNGMNPKGLTVVTNNKAIIVGHSEEEYQAIDISLESSPTRCGGMSIDAGVNGVSSVLESDGDAYSYIITGDASSEFKIIEGGTGSGGGQFASSGTFESRTFDAGDQVGFNYLSFTILEPVNTDIRLQLAINIDNSTWNYFGPDGSAATFFENPGTIPLSKISGRYIRYKATLNGNGTSAPILYDTAVNYSY